MTDVSARPRPALAHTAAALARPRPVAGAREEDLALGQIGGPTTGYTARLFSALRSAYLGGLTFDKIARMRRDYQVSSCLLVNEQPLIRADWSIVCDDDDVRTLVHDAYDKIAFDLHRSMTRAMPYGYSPNALVWDLSTDLGWHVKAIRDLDPVTCTALLDDAGSLAGFTQRQLDGRPVTIDPEYTLWITERMESGNVYGRSVLEAALEPWIDKAAVRAFRTRALERFGEPVVVMRAPAGMTIANQAEIAAAAAETPPRIVDPQLVDNLDTAQEIGTNLRHHTVVTFPSTQHVGPDGKPTGFAWDASYLEAAGSTDSGFRDALQDADKGIARAVFVPDLLFGDGNGVGSYALGDSHRDVWQAAVEGRLDDYSRQITRQLLDPIRELNFGEGAPSARLEFAPLADELRDQLWEIASGMIERGQLTADGAEIAGRLGIPLGDPADYPLPAAAPVAPGAVPPVAGAAADRESITLADPVVATLASSGNVDGLPAWKLPQAFDPPAAFARDLTPRERRVGFLALERGMNTAEATTVDAVTELLEVERARVLRQLDAVLRKGTRAEVVAALSTIELKGQGAVARAWATLMGDVWAVALEQLAGEVEAYAAQLPDAIGPEGRALVKSYTSTSAERVFAQITSEVRLELLNAYTSGVTAAGMTAVVGDLFDAYEGGEGKPIRLTTRMLSSKALNASRRDAIERGGIPLKGAQYSALLDRRTCDLCRELDEQVIAVTHTDLQRFTPPVHHNCRCVWVWITADELDFTADWKSPAPSTVDRFGGLVF